MDQKKRRIRARTPAEGIDSFGDPLTCSEKGLILLGAVMREWDPSTEEFIPSIVR